MIKVGDWVKPNPKRNFDYISHGKAYEVVDVVPGGILVKVNPGLHYKTWMYSPGDVIKTFRYTRKTNYVRLP